MKQARPLILTWMAFGGIAVGALAYLLWKGRGNTFFYDEWWWIQFRRNGIGAIFDSYNSHLEVVPIAVYQLLFHSIGIGHYRVYRALAAVAHLACATAVFAYARRRIGPAALLFALPVAFLGSGWEFILWGVNFGFSASIALGIAALMAIEHDGRRAGIWTCALLTAGLAFSETALLFALGLAVEVTWRDRGIRRGWTWGIPLVLYGAWWLALYTSDVKGHPLGKMPNFFVDLAASAAGALFGLGLHLGWIVLAGVVLLLVWRLRRPGALTPRLAALATALVLFWLLVTFGRAQLGQPSASRYVYTGAVLIVLVVVEALRGARLRTAAVLVGAILAGLAVFGNLRALNTGEDGLLIGSRTEAAELGALGLARGSAPAGLVVDSHYAPQIFAGAYFTAVRDLGSTPADSPEQILHRPEQMRAAADEVLIRAGMIRRRSRARAQRAPCAESGRDLELPASGLVLRTGPAWVQVRVRRFASSFDNDPVAVVGPRRTLSISAVKDAYALAWHMKIHCYRPQP